MAVYILKVSQTKLAAAYVQVLALVTEFIVQVMHSLLIYVKGVGSGWSRWDALSPEALTSYMCKWVFTPKNERRETRTLGIHLREIDRNHRQILAASNHFRSLIDRWKPCYKEVDMFVLFERGVSTLLLYLRSSSTGTGQEHTLYNVYTHTRHYLNTCMIHSNIVKDDYYMHVHVHVLLHACTCTCTW